MIALIDTNVYIDLVEKREPNASESQKLLRLCRRKGVQMFVAWHTVSNIWYLARKFAGRDWALKAIPILLRTASVPRAGTVEINRALELGFKDFEDGMQAVIAETCKADYVVTRNLKDFQTSPVPAISPGDFSAIVHAL